MPRDALLSERALGTLASHGLGTMSQSHVVIDDLLRPDVARSVHEELEHFRGRWKHRRHLGQRKRIFTDQGRMPPGTRNLVWALNGPAFVERVEAVSGVRGLVPDPALDGAGLCEMRPGDFMRPHRDSLGHLTRRRWRRQIALFIFLTPDWQECYGGSLTLWSGQNGDDPVRILPRFNRCVVFANPTDVVHGVDPVRCPEGTARRSISLYYYSQERDVLPLTPTAYGQAGSNGSARGTAALNRSVVWLYFALRRWFSRE
jgi:hypothetical protein